MAGYIYLLREREFIFSKQHIYKIGKTQQQDCRRFSGYPKGSEIKIILQVAKCDDAEKELLQIFDTKFINKKVIGREYYEGNFIMMISEICKYIPNEITEPELITETKIDTNIKVLDDNIKNLFKMIRRDITTNLYNHYRLYDAENIYNMCNINMCNNVSGQYSISDDPLISDKTIDFKKAFLAIKKLYDNPTKNKKISCEYYHNFAGVHNSINNITYNVQQYEGIRLELIKYGKKYIKITIPLISRYDENIYAANIIKCQDYDINGRLYKGNYPF